MASTDKSYPLNSLYKNEESLDWYRQVGPPYPYSPPQPPAAASGYGPDSTNYPQQCEGIPSNQPAYPPPQAQSYPPPPQQGYPPQQQSYPPGQASPPPPQQGYPPSQAYPPRQPRPGYAWQQGGAGVGLSPPQGQSPEYQGYAAGQASPPPPQQQPQQFYGPPWQGGEGGLYPPQPPVYSTYTPQQGTAAPLYSQSYVVETMGANPQHLEGKATKTRSRSFSQGLRGLFHKDKEAAAEGIAPVEKGKLKNTRSRSLSEGLRTLFRPEDHSKATAAYPAGQGLVAEETLVAHSTETSHPERSGGAHEHEEKKEEKKHKKADAMATGLQALEVAGEALNVLDILSSLNF